MNRIQALVGFVLACFVAETVYTLWSMGYVGFFEAANANPATRLMMLDLVIALTMISVWLVRDARRRGRPTIPYLLLTATFGAAGPLLYLLGRRPEGEDVPR